MRSNRHAIGDALSSKERLTPLRFSLCERLQPESCRCLLLDHIRSTHPHPTRKGERLPRAPILRRGIRGFAEGESLLINPNEHGGALQRRRMGACDNA